MSHSYTAVGWNRQKKIYDRVIGATVLLYLALFVGAGVVLYPTATIETLLIRGFGTSAILLLHVILSIGPLSRLDRRFLPLLYNRRHLGVTMFILALAHGGFSMVQFHFLGNVNPMVSVLTSNGRYDSLAQFPFQTLGLLALTVFFLMAATSHDFWLAILTAPVWKTLHMLVYVAYGLVVLHVVLGVLQAETHWVLASLLSVGVAWILGVHLVAGRKESALDAGTDLREMADDGFIEVCDYSEIPENRARIVSLAGERIAIFRYGGKISAVSNVCQHQNGPLGEGCIIKGCIVCPWHGYEYDPETGASPPPFTEKVPTFEVRLKGDRVQVNPQAHPPGTRVAAASYESA